MKINKLDASFGKLQNESLKFHDGLNIVTDSDEDRKSAWCSFIRCMLYGADGREIRENAYQPESGAPMAGSMDLTVNDCNISLIRSSRSKGAPMREFSANYSGSGDKVEELNSMNAGLQLTGLSKDAFTRCAFISRDNSRALGDSINSLLSSGEENCSVSEADAALSFWEQKRLGENHGMLPVLQDRISEAGEKLDEINSSMDKLELLEENLQNTRRTCERLESAVIESRKLQRKNSLSRLSSGRTELKQRSEDHDRAMAELALRQEALRASRFGDTSGKELESRVNSDVERYNSLSSGSENLFVVLPAIICFILAIVFAALYTSRGGLLFIIAAAVLCLVTVILLLRYAKLRQQAMQVQEEKLKILKKYKAADTDEIFEALDAHLELCNALEEAKQHEMLSRDAYDDARDIQSQLESEALSDLDFASGNSDAAKYSRELAESRAEAQKTSYEIAELNRRLSAMGDPLVLSGSLSCMKEEYNSILNEARAIILARDAMAAAEKEMQDHISPEIGRLSAKYMTAITGKKFDDLLLNRDFSANTGDIICSDLEGDYLSADTMELIYLSLRLAVSELLSRQSEPCPLIINDALSHLDEQSYNTALELLKRISKKRQVILFTSREYIPE